MEIGIQQLLNYIIWLKNCQYDEKFVHMKDNQLFC